MDFLIKNADIYNPASHSWSHGDLAIRGGLLAAPSPDMEYREVIDASGCIVTAGLIDYHVHYYDGGTDSGVNPDASSFCCGVTTAVDAGSAGAANYSLFRSTVISRSHVRVLAQLYLTNAGQTSLRCPESLDSLDFDVAGIISLFRQYPGELVGIKARISRSFVSPEKALTAISRMVETAEKAGTRVIIHVTDPPVRIDEMAGVLRPGDVICHIYHGRGSWTCLDEEGRIYDKLWAARERGVVFDGSNGIGNYDLEVCRQALSQGFYPDIISSDITTMSYFLHPLHSLPRILSKYIDMGMPLEDVLDAATLVPARLIGHPELASMEYGSPADVAIFRLREKAVGYTDWRNNHFTGSRVLVPMMTFKDGFCRYCQADFA